MEPQIYEWIRTCKTRLRWWYISGAITILLALSIGYFAFNADPLVVGVYSIIAYLVATLLYLLVISICSVFWFVIDRRSWWFLVALVVIGGAAFGLSYLNIDLGINLDEMFRSIFSK